MLDKCAPLKMSLCCFIIMGPLALTLSCITPAQKREMDDHIFRLQTRLLQLESNLANSRVADQRAGEASTKTIASTSSDVERLGIEVKRMKGDIDALRVGVQTGQMPGQEAPQEGSLGAQLSEIKARLEAVETQQKEIMQALDSGRPIAKKASDKDESKDGNKVTVAANAGVSDFENIQSAYKRKKYKEVTEMAPDILGKSKGKERMSLLMIYGESLMKLKRPKEAALQFNELVELKPGEKQMALAKLRLGDAFKAMGDKDTSKLFYDEVATKYAGTPEGDKAKKALKSKH